MPTGYTAEVADGSATDLETFVMRLARGMGALLPMRDEPSSARIPEKFEPSSYNKEQLVKLENDLKHYLELTGDDLLFEWCEARQRVDTARVNREQQLELERERYLKMIEAVEAWTGQPEGIKEFALEQLHSGMEFDCPKEFKWYGEVISDNPKAWRLGQLARITSDIDYHTKSYAKECERTNSRNEWLAQLRESLK